MYNHVVSQTQRTDDVLNSNLSDEAKILLYQEKERNMQRQRMNRENKPVIVRDDSTKSKLDAIIKMIQEKQAFDPEYPVDHLINPDNEDEASILDEEMEYDVPYTSLKRKQNSLPLPNGNKKFLMKASKNYKDGMEKDLKERLKNIRKPNYRFQPMYKPFPNIKIKKTRLRRQHDVTTDWDDYVDSGGSTKKKMAMNNPPPYNISKLKRLQRYEKKLMRARNMQYEDDKIPIPKKHKKWDQIINF